MHGLTFHVHFMYMYGLTDMDCGLYLWTADFDLSGTRCPVTGVNGTTPVAGRRSGGPWIWLDSHPSRRWMGCPVRHWTARVTSSHTGLDAPCLCTLTKPCAVGLRLRMWNFFSTHMRGHDHDGPPGDARGQGGRGGGPGARHLAGPPASRKRGPALRGLRAWSRLLRETASRGRQKFCRRT